MLVDPGTPWTPRELADALVRVAAGGRAMLEQLDDASFHAPQGDAWSPAWHVRHLRKATAPIALALATHPLLLMMRFGWHRGRSRTFTEMRDVYRAALAAGGTAGRFTPSAEQDTMPPDERRRRIMAAWQASIDDTAARLRRWPERRVDLVRLPHPLLGPLSMREMMAFTVYHTAHHLQRVHERSKVAGARKAR